MNLHLAIVDDRAEDIKRLEHDITRFFAYRLEQHAYVEAFPSGEAFLEAFHPDAYHLAFLDICMDGINGIELAQRLRAEDPKLLIVFLTTSSEYAFDAFPVHPFDYLIKPYELKKLHSVLQEMLRVLSVSERTITIRIARDSYDVPIRRIVSVVSEGHTVTLRVLNHEPLRSIMTFADIMEQLGDDPRFLSCNRGVLVNMDHVRSLEGNNICMTDSSSYPLRVRDRAELISAFTQYTLSRMERE